MNIDAHSIKAMLKVPLNQARGIAYKLAQWDCLIVTYQDWMDRAYKPPLTGVGGNPLPVFKCRGNMSEDGWSYGPRMPCDGVRYQSGAIKGSCGEPCGFVMGKAGTVRIPYIDLNVDSCAGQPLPEGEYTIIIASSSKDNPKSDKIIDRYLKDPKPDPKKQAEAEKEDRFKKAGEAIARNI